MKILTDIRLFYKRKLLELLRNPPFIFMGISTPILYLALFSPLLKNFAGAPGFPEGNILNTFVPGMLILTAFYNGLFAGWGVIDELRNGVIDRFRVSPCSRFSILAGPVLRDLVAVLFQNLFFVLIALPFGFRFDPLGMLILFSLFSLLLACSSTLANALGLITKSEDKLAPIIQGITLPITLLSGMLLPMELAPTWLRAVAHFNPLFYVVQAARELTAGHIGAPVVIQAFIIMSLLTVVTLRWGTNLFRKAVA
ncbi:MAG: ABC transporter permease [Chlamydiales bacterium]